MDQYPKADAERSGCKVGWLYYKKKSDANKAAKIAEKKARRLEAQGFDWGYQCPGHIVKMNPASQYAGMYEVTIP